MWKSKVSDNEKSALFFSNNTSAGNLSIKSSILACAILACRGEVTGREKFQETNDSLSYSNLIKMICNDKATYTEHTF